MDIRDKLKSEGFDPGDVEMFLDVCQGAFDLIYDKIGDDCGNVKLTDLVCCALAFKITSDKILSFTEGATDKDFLERAEYGRKME